MVAEILRDFPDVVNAAKCLPTVQHDVEHHIRTLNLVTEADVYPLPNMLDFSDRLSGCTVFSKIDLCKGYW